MPPLASKLLVVAAARITLLTCSSCVPREAPRGRLFRVSPSTLSLSRRLLLLVSAPCSRSLQTFAASAACGMAAAVGIAPPPEVLPVTGVYPGITFPSRAQIPPTTPFLTCCQQALLRVPQGSPLFGAVGARRVGNLTFANFLNATYYPGTDCVTALLSAMSTALGSSFDPALMCQHPYIEPDAADLAAAEAADKGKRTTRKIPCPICISADVQQFNRGTVFCDHIDSVHFDIASPFPHPHHFTMTTEHESLGHAVAKLREIEVGSNHAYSKSGTPYRLKDGSLVHRYNCSATPQSNSYFYEKSVNAHSKLQVLESLGKDPSFVRAALCFTGCV